MSGDWLVWSDRVFAGLVDGLWQGVLLAFVLACLRWVVRGSSGATRYAVSFIFLVAIGLLPFVAGQRAPEEPARTRSVVQSFEDSKTPRVVPTDTAMSPSRGAAEASSDTRSEGRFQMSRQSDSLPWMDAFDERTRAAIVGLWITLAAIGLLRLLRSCRGLIRLKHRASPFDGADGTLPKQALTKRRYRVAVSEDVAAPVMLGWLRPAICLPTKWRDWERNELEQVVLHELAHLARWDDFSLLLQRAIEAVLFFHPAVWWIGRTLDLDREVACDDRVVALTQEPKSYAVCLTKLAVGASNLNQKLAPGMVHRVEQLPRRIRMLMDSKRAENQKLSTTFVVAVALMLGAALVVSSDFAPAVEAYRAKHPERSASERPAAVQLRVQGDEEEAAKRRREAASAASQASRQVLEAEAARERERISQEQQLALATEYQDLAESAERQRLELAQQLERHRQELEQLSRTRRHELERELEQARELIRARQQSGDAIDVERELAQKEREFDEQLRQLEQDYELQSRIFEDENAMRREHLEQSLAQHDGMLRRRMTLATVPTLAATATREPVISQDELLSLMVSIAENDTDEEVRRAALRQLTAARGEAAAEAMSRLYDSLDDGEAKSELLRSLAANATEPALDKLKAIARGEADAELRLQAVEILGALGRGAPAFAPRPFIAPYPGAMLAVPPAPPVPAPNAPPEPPPR